VEPDPDPLPVEPDPVDEPVPVEPELEPEETDPVVPVPVVPVPVEPVPVEPELEYSEEPVPVPEEPVPEDPEEEVGGFAALVVLGLGDAAAAGLSAVLGEGAGSGLEAGFFSEELELSFCSVGPPLEQDSIACIHFLRSSSVGQASSLFCAFFLSPASFIQNLSFLESPAVALMPSKGMILVLPPSLWA